MRHISWEDLGQLADKCSNSDMFFSGDSSLKLKLSAQPQEDLTNTLSEVLVKQLSPLLGELECLKSKQDDVISELSRMNLDAEKQAKEESVEDIAAKVQDIEKQLDKYLHRPSLESIMKKVKEVGGSISALLKSDAAIEVRIKDCTEEVKKLQVLGKTTGTDLSIEAKEAFKLIFETLPESEGVLLAGDRNLDFMKNRMADVLFDLLPKAKFVTSKIARCGQLLSLGSLGPMLKELNESTRVLVLSIGKDDLLSDPAILLEATSQGADPDARDKHNLITINAVAARVNEIIKKVVHDFPKVKVLYVAPPPSVREAKLFMQFRESLKKLEIFRTVSYLDVLDVLSGEEAWETTESGTDPGCLTWSANRSLMNIVYTSIVPNNNITFCEKCLGVHSTYCPGKNAMAEGPEKPTLERDQCWFCLEKGHRSVSCEVKESLKKRRIWCPHCGSSPEKLAHNPDFCKARFVVCEICDQAGHMTDVHSNPAQLKKVFDRIGFNLTVKDAPNLADEKASKKRKRGDNPCEDLMTGSAD